MAAISLFWDTNMAVVTSCENPLYCKQNCSVHWNSKWSKVRENTYGGYGKTGKEGSVILVFFFSP